MNDPTAIFAFFDGPSEVRSQMISGTGKGSAWPENSGAAYSNPKTIGQVTDLDSEKPDGRTIYGEHHPHTGKLSLWASNRFTEDIEEHHNRGVLPVVDAGHHTSYR